MEKGAEGVRKRGQEGVKWGGGGSRRGQQGVKWGGEGNRGQEGVKGREQEAGRG